MWGDGKQTRSFTYIDDCVEGILRITKSEFREPLNLGSCEMVSMNDMMSMVARIEAKVCIWTGGQGGGCCGFWGASAHGRVGVWPLMWGGGG